VEIVEHEQDGALTRGGRQPIRYGLEELVPLGLCI